MRFASKGEVVIPLDIRELAGLPPHAGVDFDGKHVRIVKAPDGQQPGAARVSSPDCAARGMSP